MGRLDNKVAIVTGGARGLGKVFCMALAEEGARIVVADILKDEARQTAEEIREKGGSSISMKVDVSSEEETSRMAEETIREYGGIDILVNNAAMIFGIGRKPFHEITAEQWNRLMIVNLGGPFLCAKAVFPRMKA